MRTSILTLLLISFSVSLFGQNENPYKQFGYEAPIMPDEEVIEWNKVSEFRVINTDTTSAVGSLTIDVPNRRVIFYNRNGLVIKQDTLEVYSMARWFSVDPKNQFSSPYLAMGNNPVMYVDPDGQWVHIVIGAVVGGVVNLATNWKNIDNVWEGVAAFGVGAGVGAATAACGACGGAVAIALGGGALMGASNNVIGQTGNGVGFNQVNWGMVGTSAAIGGISGVAGYGAGSFASNNLASPLINSMSVQSPVLAGMINGTISGAVGGYAGGFTGGLLFTGDIAAANQYGISGLKLGASLGGGIGASSSYVSARSQGINPWTGRPTVAKYQSDNINYLRKFAGSKGWERNPNSNIEEYGVYGDDGYSWRLKIKLEASQRPGIQSGSLYPRASVRTDLGNFYNPFTNQNVPAAIGGHIPLQQSYPTVLPSPVQLNWWWR